MLRIISCCILILVLLSISSCSSDYPVRSSNELSEPIESSNELSEPIESSHELTELVESSPEVTEAVEPSHELTKNEAIQLVANKYYDGDTDGIWVEELGNNNYIVKLTYDMGTGLISTANAHLVINGQIIASLIDENGATDDYFWQKADEYRE